ncbi:MAG: hypothetical protein IKP71_01455 [Candidatus Riflebacteria bacterium]|nr:hypothetical protein [Candidatus Riflebacteria bacterium]
MSLRINQNVTSLATYSNLNRSAFRLDNSIQKLSSGLRINSAADDAAGLTISEKMRSQIKGLNRAKLNCQDGMSMLQTAEGGLNESESIMQRLRELAIQSSNDTLTTNDRLEIQKEVNQLRDAIDDISNATEFNTKKLLDGSQAALISASSHSVIGVAKGAGVDGGDFSVSMAIVEGGISQMQTSQIFLNKNTGELAQGNTKLEDIAQFYDDNGVFAVAIPQTLFVTGNSESYEFTIDGKMTLNELAAAMQNALASTNALGIRNSQVTVISTAQSGVSGVGGYLQLTSGKVGDVGDFSIAGDQAVIDALGLTVSRQSKNNLVAFNLKDAFGNTRKATTSTDRVSGLLDGIDLRFDASPAQIAGVGGIVDGLKFSVAEKLEFEFQVSASTTSVTAISVSFALDSTYSMEGIAAAINTAIKEQAANSGMEASVVDGQIRLSYSPTNHNAPTEIKVTSGSECIGIINGTYTGFVDGDKNLDAAIKGFSLLTDSDKASANLSIKINGDGTASITISVGKTITMTAGADLVEINSWITKWNAEIVNASVAARLDEVNGSIAITSTYIGKFNRSNASAIQSRLTVESIASTNTAITSMDLFGYKDGTAKGNGDTNFRLHVVDNSPSFQIGANQGQNMSISIGDMSAGALGIDKIDMTTVEGSQIALSKIDNALSILSSERSKLGAFMNRMEYTKNNLENAGTNMTDSESRIRDLDMASEMTEFSSAQVLQQAATAMLAQANASSQSVLQLLQ